MGPNSITLFLFGEVEPTRPTGHFHTGWFFEFFHLVHLWRDEHLSRRTRATCEFSVAPPVLFIRGVPRSTCATWSLDLGVVHVPLSPRAWPLDVQWVTLIQVRMVMLNQSLAATALSQAMCSVVDEQVTVVAGTFAIMFVAGQI